MKKKVKQPEFTDDELSVLSDAALMTYQHAAPADPQVEAWFVSAQHKLNKYLEAIDYKGTNMDGFDGYAARAQAIEELAAA